MGSPAAFPEVWTAAAASLAAWAEHWVTAAAARGKAGGALADSLEVDAEHTAEHMPDAKIRRRAKVLSSRCTVH